MRASIDIDVGGTFTDCAFIRNGDIYMAKAPTTTYDLSICFMNALKSVATDVGLSIEHLLEETEIIRYSTTIAMNTLIQRKGPKLGLITTEGMEDVIQIGRGEQWAIGLSFREMRNLAAAKRPELLISREMTIGAKERINSNGEVVRPLDEDDFRQKLDYLVSKGARGFVIALLWSHLNARHEERIEEIIRGEYPESYLGSVPVMLSSKVLPKRLEYPRTMAVILNAYLQHAMAEELQGMGDELRDLGYRKPMMLVHNNGGMAEVFRTSAIQTYNGGPVAGLVGSAHIGKLHGFENIMVTDMGGTSFDLGMLIQGSPRFYAWQPSIEHWAIDITMLESISIGAGGGSIAWRNPALSNRLEIGPQSSGSMPGPACYDQGGTEPTVTDADVVLGYVNTDYFHGGQLRLNRESAVESIRERIAQPLGIDIEHAALLIKKVVDGNMGGLIFKFRQNMMEID